jgi:hypothetical protein
MSRCRLFTMSQTVFLAEEEEKIRILNSTGAFFLQCQHHINLLPSDRVTHSKQ